VAAPAEDPSHLVPRLICQALSGVDLDQVNDLIASGFDVYLAMFDFEHESHAPRIKAVSQRQSDDDDVTVTFSEKVLPDKRVAADEKVTVYYLRPFNPE
jgi:hypothetical protein